MRLLQVGGVEAKKLEAEGRTVPNVLVLRLDSVCIARLSPKSDTWVQSQDASAQQVVADGSQHIFAGSDRLLLEWLVLQRRPPASSQDHRLASSATACQTATTCHTASRSLGCQMQPVVESPHGCVRVASTNAAEWT